MRSRYNIRLRSGRSSRQEIVDLRLFLQAVKFAIHRNPDLLFTNVLFEFFLHDRHVFHDRICKAKAFENDKLVADCENT